MKPSELLDRPEHWCKGAEAMDAEGNIVDCHSPLATSWCLVGAIRYCLPNEDERIEALINLDKTLHDKFKVMQPMVFFNDDPDTTFLQIQMVLKEAGL